MDLKNIKLKYECFVEYLSYTDSILSELIIDTEKFFEEYCKNDYIDEIFRDNFLLNLIYLKIFDKKIYDILKYLNEVTLPYTEQPIAKIYYIEDYFKDLYEYDEDMYVDLNNIPNFSKITGMSNLRLCDGNEYEE